MTGKIVSPWQQLFMLRVSIEKNKRAKQVAGYLLEEEGSAKTMLNPSGLKLKHKELISTVSTSKGSQIAIIK